jgi:cell division protein FtsB
MEIAVLIPITAIIATAWVIVTLVRARQERRLAGDGDRKELNRENARLVQENETLRGSMRRLEERMGVLERIATDPAERTAREIEQLR